MPNVTDVLKKTSLFLNFADAELEEIEKNGKTKSYSKGSIIFSQGQPAIAAYVVIEGKVKVYKLGSDGRQYILHIFGPGEIFAESAVFAGKTYPAFGEAITDTTLFYLFKDNFLWLVEHNSSIALKMLSSQATRLREFAAKIEDLSLKEVSARLAGFLLEEAQKKGKHTPKGLELKLDMNKTQLAAFIGTISETLSRTLFRFKNQGLIEEKNNYLIVKKISNLKDIAQS